MLIFLALLIAHASAQVDVLPLPASLRSSPGCLRLDPTFSLAASGPGSDDTFLAGAIVRAARTIGTIGTRREALGVCGAPVSTLTRLLVSVATPRNGALPALRDDESYALSLMEGDGAVLSAQTVWGAMRGLETLTQLVSSSLNDPAALFIPAATVDIVDAPRFSHRGLMLDSGRGFIPVSLFNATLDAMAAVKLNVLHWHISDDEAFPLDSAAWPKLIDGAMQAPARSHVYTHADVATVVDAAAARGIRVVPEIDTPGHSSSFFIGYPSLATDCVLPPSHSFSKPMDPTLESTYSFLQALFDEVSALFPDALMHIGGDEVEMTCWSNSTNVLRFMAQHGMTDPAQVQAYFETRVAAMLPNHKRAVIWQENNGNESSYPVNAIVHVWKERAGDASVLDGLVRQGYDVLWASSDWYLDWSYVGPGASYDSHVNGAAEWMHYHAVDPLANSTLTEAEIARHFLGAEVAAWSPYSDSTNLMTMVWPRSAAVGERLWSAPGAAVDEPIALAARMHALRCRLVSRGIGAGPVEDAGSCASSWAPPFVPVYA